MMQDFQPSFERFITLINKQEARDLVRSINLFMKNFRMKEVNCESDSKAIQDFLAYMAYTAFPRHPLWAGSSPEDLESAIEGLEKYLLTKLFDRTFGVDALDRERDLAIGLRLQALQFIRPEHLEIAHEFANDAALLLAQKELAKINMFKSPRDKLACILSCCRVISNLLASKKYGAGADDFTPVLIYVTIKAHPDALASNLAFIERFRMASRLVSEVSYMFVQMQSAVAFVEMLDVRTSLKVDQDELIAHMLAAGAFTDADLAMLQQPEPKGGSVSALQSQSSEAAAIALVEAAESRAAANAPGKGVGAKQPTDLIDFDSGPEPHAQPSTNGQAWSISATSTATDGHTHSSATSQPPQPPRNPGHSRAGSQSDAWHSHAPHHSRTPSTTFANLLDSEMPNPLLWNDPFQQHQQHQLNQQQWPHPVQLPPHPYSPHPLPPVHPQMYAPPVPQPPYYAPAAPQQPPVWRSGSVGYNPGTLAHPPPPPPPPPVPPPPSLPGGPNQTYPFTPAPAFVPPPPPPPPPVPPPPPHLPSSLADPSVITRTTSIPTAQGTRSMVAAGSMRASSAAELEEHGVQLLLAADAAGELQERYPLFHASVDALTLADVKRLLDQFKELVIKYECLARAVEEPHRAVHAQSQHPAPPTTGTPTFRDPASTFFATSTGVPLSLASTAQSTAASTAHPPPPPPPPANNAEQQQQQQQRQQQQQQQQHTGGTETLGQPEGQHSQPLITPKNESKPSAQPSEQQPLPAATQGREHSAVPHVQHSQPAAPQPVGLRNPAPEENAPQPPQHEELDLKSGGHQPHAAGAQQEEGPRSKPLREEHQTAGAQQQDEMEKHQTMGAQQQGETEKHRTVGAQHVDEHSPQTPKDEQGQQEEPQAQHQTACVQEQKGPQAVDAQKQEEPQTQHQTSGAQEQVEPQAQKPESQAQLQTAGALEQNEYSRHPEGHPRQPAAAQQQAWHSPGTSKNEHGQLAAAQQGAHPQGEEDQTKSQTESAQAHDAAQQATSTVASGHSTQQPPSLGSTQVLDVPPMTQTESTQAHDAAQQATSTVASEPSTVQQDPVLGSDLVIDVPEMEQSIRHEAEEDGMQWRRCALYSMAPHAGNSMREEGGEGGAYSMGEEEAKSMVHGVEDGSAPGVNVVAASTQQAEKVQEQEHQQQAEGDHGTAQVQGQDGDLLGGDVACEQLQQQQHNHHHHHHQQFEGNHGTSAARGQDKDLLGGDAASEQPCPFDSTQGSTFAGSSTVDAIIGQGVEHWMLGSMSQEGNNDATSASVRSTELGS